MLLRKGSQADIDLIQSSIWKPRHYFTWGFSDEVADNRFPLLAAGQLCVFAGSEGSGKSTWSIEMAKRNAEREASIPTGYLSLEVDPYRMIQRYSERRAGLTRFDVRDGIDVEDDRNAAITATEHATKEFINSGLHLFPKLEEKQSPASIASIEQLCADEYGPRLLFIDNLAELEPDVLVKDEYSKHDIIIRRLLQICKSTQTTIVLLHHLAKPKLAEPLNINSIKGNNVVITKADVVVAIDKHKEANPNWECSRMRADGKMVDPKIRKAFLALAPQIEVRKVEVFKDRDFDVRGVMGYLKLTNGKLDCMTYEELRSTHFLWDDEKLRYTEALEHFDLQPY